MYKKLLHKSKLHSTKQINNQINRVAKVVKKYMIAEIIAIGNNSGNGLYNGTDIIMNNTNIFIILSCDGNGVVVGDSDDILIKK